MEFSYDTGIYIEGDKKIAGQIILSEHKLYLKNSKGELAQTYIPLEKIERICKVKGGLELNVRPSLAYRYTAYIKGKSKRMSELAEEIVKRRGLKKKFLKNEWVEVVQ